MLLSLSLSALWLPGIFKNKTLSLIFKILGFVIVAAGIIDLLKALGIF